MKSNPETSCTPVIVLSNKMNTHAYIIINPDIKETMPCTEYMYSTVIKCLRDSLKKPKKQKKKR